MVHVGVGSEAAREEGGAVTLAAWVGALPAIVWIVPLVFIMTLFMMGPVLAVIATIGTLLAWQKWGKKS